MVSAVFPRRTGRVICRFSCGAASAVATKLALGSYPPGSVDIYYNDTGSEHPDNKRFLADCEKWFGQPIITLRSKKFRNIWEVFENYRFLVSHKGAPCTGELKRIPGEAVWNLGDIEVFGYTAGEERRVARFQEDNNERIIDTPLITHGITKNACFSVLKAAGIALPVMYLLGFRNNNCIGCVKARDNLNYWKRIRQYFPAVFWRMAKLERKFNFNINRRTRGGVRRPIFLDEIEPGLPSGPDPKMSCGLFCTSENDEPTNESNG